MATQFNLNWGRCNATQGDLGMAGSFQPATVFALIRRSLTTF